MSNNIANNQKLLTASGEQPSQAPVIIFRDEYDSTCSDELRNILSLGQGQRFTINLMDMGSKIERLSLFAKISEISDVSLSPEELETSVAIMKSLPEGAKISDFADACDADTAIRLGISLEALEACRPLLAALRATDKPDRHSRVFNEA